LKACHDERVAKRGASAAQPQLHLSDALDDRLTQGLDDVSARTVTLYRDTIAPAQRKQLEAIRLRKPSRARASGGAPPEHTLGSSGQRPQSPYPVFSDAGFPL
jgi:hypothetical protein